MKRVIALIVVALVLAAGTGFASYYYLNQAEDRALAQLDPVDVLQTAGNISAGTTWADAQAQGLVRTVQVPAKYANSTLVTSATALPNEFVANRNLSANQLIFSGDFQATTALPQLLPIPDGYVALTADMGVSARVAPFISPGDKVALYARGTGEKAGERVVFDEITILAIGNLTVLGVSPSAEVAAGTVTFAVPNDRALDFLDAVQSGGLYLAKLPNASTAVTQ